jgi:hypothetical protein
MSGFCYNDILGLIIRFGVKVRVTFRFRGRQNRIFEWEYISIAQKVMYIYENKAVCVVSSDLS